jgi:hypothetical protein
MCFASSKPAPAPVAAAAPLPDPTPPPIQKPAMIADPVVQASRTEAQNRVRQQKGARSTILTQATLLASNREGSGERQRGKTLLGE